MNGHEPLPGIDTLTVLTSIQIWQKLKSKSERKTQHLKLDT